MDSEKVSFNIVRKIEELKNRESEEVKDLYKDLNLNAPRKILGRKILDMIDLKEMEEHFENVSFDKEEREAIVKSEEIRRSSFSNQSYVLPFAIATTIGYMAVTKRCMRIDTFLANFNLLAGVFAGAYFVPNVFLNLHYNRKIDNYNTVLEKVYEKAESHVSCVAAMPNLKFDDDIHLE